MRTCKICNLAKDDSQAYPYSIYVGKRHEYREEDGGRTRVYVYKDLRRIQYSFCKDCLAEKEKGEKKNARIGLILIGLSVLVIFGAKQILPGGLMAVIGTGLLFMGGLFQKEFMFRLSKEIALSENENLKDPDYVFFDKAEYGGLKEV
jgi:hypothetical protein